MLLAGNQLYDRSTNRRGNIFEILKNYTCFLLSLEFYQYLTNIIYIFRAPAVFFIIGLVLVANRKTLCAYHVPEYARQ